MSDNGHVVSEQSIDYSAVLTAISAREAQADRRADHWRQAAMLASCLALGLLVGLLFSIQKSQTKYVKVHQTEEGTIRVQHSPDRGWTVSELETRGELMRFIIRSRAFGTDEHAIAQARLIAWQQAFKPAQVWLKQQFNALPIEQVRKTAVRLVEYAPGVPDIRMVPPTVGRTWEVYWQEEQSTVQRQTLQRKAFQAFIVVRIKEPTTDAEANHLGVWIEDITVHDRVPAQATVPESPARAEQPGGSLRLP